MFDLLNTEVKIDNKEGWLKLAVGMKNLRAFELWEIFDRLEQLVTSDRMVGYMENMSVMTHGK